jgi:O-antigen ligase
MTIVDRARFIPLGDWLATAVAVSLPWSTSATGILVGLWVAGLAFTLDRASLRRVALAPAAAILPVALVLLCICGMFWSEVAWPERLLGAEAFAKLLALPLLLIEFSRTDRGEQVLTAFFMSASALLLLSWLLVIVPGFPWAEKDYGVPVKDYIAQSGIFTLCFFALLDRAAQIWARSRTTSLLLTGWAFVFLANIFFVALSRTSLVVIVVLFVLLELRHFGRRGLAPFIAAVAVLAVAAWATSPYLRFRVTNVVTELETFSDKVQTSAGDRVQFWKMSLEIVRVAPLFGHGTGSTRAMFAHVAGTQPSAFGAATNPHNQIFAVAIPLGLAGVVLLIAMWIAHWRMFLAPGHAAWVGIIVVTQNVIGSLFNSHILDFTQGWIYVFGVGVAGGIMLRERCGEQVARGDATARLCVP